MIVGILEVMANAATEELARVLDHQRQLEARVGEVDAEARAASEAVQAASAVLVALERRAAGGEKVTAAGRREAEDRLLQARSRAAAPWSERRRAAQLAAQDARRATAAFVAEHLDALLADLEAEGRAAAGAFDAAARAVPDAHAARAAVEQRTFGLISLPGRVQPGDVARSRGEQLAREAERLLIAGGEQPPDVLQRPDGPRHGTVVEPVSA